MATCERTGQEVELQPYGGTAAWVYCPECKQVLHADTLEPVFGHADVPR